MRTRKDEIKEDIKYYATCSVPFILGGLVIGSLGFMLYEPFKVDSTKDLIKNKNEAINQNIDELGKNIATSFDLNNFDVDSGKVYLDNGNYVVEFLGTSDVEVEKNINEKEILKLTANISNESASNILKLAEEYTQKYNKFSDYLVGDGINSVDGPFSIKEGLTGGQYVSFSKSKFKDVSNAYESLIDAFAEATENSYNKQVNYVAEFSQMYGQISNNYRITSPDLVPDVSGLIVSTDYKKLGMRIADISNVEKSKNNDNLQFFTITTIHVNADQQVTTQTAMVTVEGKDLTQEEVYAKYLAGEYKEFKLVKKTESSQNKQAETGLTF